jgi:hypothetical protein
VLVILFGGYKVMLGCLSIDEALCGQSLVPCPLSLQKLDGHHNYSHGVKKQVFLRLRFILCIKRLQVATIYLQSNRCKIAIGRSLLLF